MTRPKPSASISDLGQRVDQHRLTHTCGDESIDIRNKILQSTWTAIGTMSAYDKGADGQCSTNQKVKADSQLAAAAEKTSEALKGLSEVMGTDDMRRCGEAFSGASADQQAQMFRKIWDVCHSTLRWHITAEERNMVWGTDSSGVGDEGWTDDFSAGSGLED